MKDNFYRTMNERMVAAVADKYYNDEIGGRENHFYDEGEMLPISEEELVDLITDEMMNEKKVLWTESGYGIEAKHVRFIGKERVREIVAHRVSKRHNAEGTWVWEN